MFYSPLKNKTTLQYLSDILWRRPTVFLNNEIHEKPLASNEPYFTWLEYNVYSLWKKLV